LRGKWHLLLFAFGGIFAALSVYHFFALFIAGIEGLGGREHYLPIGEDAIWAAILFAIGTVWWKIDRRRQ
jgi:hypothetical protein